MLVKKFFPVVILAGGLGTRVSSISVNYPKALLPINGVPFIAHQLKLLASNGAKKIVLCVGHQGEQMREFIKDGAAFNLTVSYSDEGESLLGTGGAIQLALPLLEDDFFVLYGDSYLQCDYQSVQNAYINSGKLGLMTVYNNQNQWNKSNIDFDGKNIRHYSKKNHLASMNYIDYGLSVFSKKAFVHFTEKENFDLSEVHEYLLMKNQLAAFEMHKRFYEIGSVDGIAALEKYFSERDER